MSHVATTQFREHLLAWLDKAGRGEEVIIVRHGRPSLRLMPVQPDQAQASAALAQWRARAILHDVTSPALPEDDWEMAR